MPSLTRTGIKSSAVQSPGNDPASHQVVLRQLKEVVEVGQRVRGDPNDSFVRVSELVKLGLARLVNGTLQPYASQGSTTVPVSSSRNIFTPYSVVGGGNLSADLTLALSGDVATPGANAYYGTAGAGTKGWFSMPPLPTFMMGANWAASSGPVTLPTNDVLIEIPRACTLAEVTILTSGGPGGCVIDIWKGTYSSYPPNIGGQITGGVPPAIVSASKYTNTTLSGWTTSFAAGDILLITLTSSTNFTQISIKLRML